MEQFFLDLWHNKVYQAVLVLVFVELILLATQSLWLVFRDIRRSVKERRQEAFERELGESFFDAILDPEEGEVWVAKAKRHGESTVRGYLEPRLRVLAGDALEGLSAIYRGLGLIERDLAMLRSRMWHRRVLAMRRLVFVAGEPERSALLATRGDARAVSLLAAQGLARIGSGDDVVEVLRDLEVPRRLMEQPVFVLLSSLKPQQFERVVEGYEQFTSDSMRKIVLIAAARRGKVRIELVADAARSDSVELRFGAATASSFMSCQPSEEILTTLLGDEVSEVRALAARSLGRRKALGALRSLARATGDSSFWVRQNVAAALGSLGEVGRLELERIVEEAEDTFAVDTARQELERMRVLSARSAG